MASVLVADDEELARFTIREILEAEGHTVVEAKNGVEAIDLFTKQPTDIIVTDIIMPDKEGIETIIELKRDHPGIKIVAISGGGRTRNLDFLELAKRYGADAVLAKPFSEQELIDVINTLLA
ncbi:response regulator [Pseudomonadota bacterium]